MYRERAAAIATGYPESRPDHYPKLRVDLSLRDFPSALVSLPASCFRSQHCLVKERARMIGYASYSDILLCRSSVPRRALNAVVSLVLPLLRASTVRFAKGKGISVYTDSDLTRREAK